MAKPYFKYSYLDIISSKYSSFMLFLSTQFPFPVHLVVSYPYHYIHLWQELRFKWPKNWSLDSIDWSSSQVISAALNIALSMRVWGDPRTRLTSKEKVSQPEKDGHIEWEYSKTHYDNWVCHGLSENGNIQAWHESLLFWCRVAILGPAVIVSKRPRPTSGPFQVSRCPLLAQLRLLLWV